MSLDSIIINSEQCRFDTTEATTVGVSDTSSLPSGQGTASQGPTKRRPGRPRGAKNKLSNDARELLATRGLAGIKVLCDIAAGRTIYRPLRGGKGREALSPSLDQMIAAQKIVVSRLVPDLKAVEQVVDATVRDVSAPQYDKRQVARAIISVLGSSIEGGYPPSESSGEAWMMPSLPKKSDENSRDRFDSPSTPSENETEVGNYHRWGQPR